MHDVRLIAAGCKAHRHVVDGTNGPDLGKVISGSDLPRGFAEIRVPNRSLAPRPATETRR